MNTPGLSIPRLVPAIVLGAWTLSLAAAEKPYTFLDYVNLAFHEAGHVFLVPFGRTLHFLGGTLFQVGIPLGLTSYFLLKRQRFSAAPCLWWAGENLINVSVYMADARELALPLVGGGENDWNELFYRFGLLGEDSVRAISSFTHHLGVAVMLCAVAWIACFALPPARREAIASSLAGRFPRLSILFE